MVMLDKPDKTRALIAMLKAAVPFEVQLLPSTLERLKANNPSVTTTETVFQIAYEPEHGGIICLIRPRGTNDLIATSLTHIRINRASPFAMAVIDYQTHRAKKLKKKRGQR